ncbi:hypothetical protein ABN222_15215 [Providencia alcalifaciens]|uniref:hypothetical protein n=1 Tax=Providencia sp. wls1921 TaxID=2675153 RepID=UPI0018A6DF8E|nr:hypothetical protein [Providencia sp. wls1921]HEQ1858335.1 hypothetical protein [Providencia alcalifaciens]
MKKSRLSQYKQKWLLELFIAGFHSPYRGRQAKRHMRIFNGIPKAYFEQYLKECEWRFKTCEVPNSN